jgi:hypothetical protein
MSGYNRRPQRRDFGPMQRVWQYKNRASAKAKKTTEWQECPRTMAPSSIAIYPSSDNPAPWLVTVQARRNAEFPLRRNRHPTRHAAERPSSDEPTGGHTKIVTVRIRSSGHDKHLAKNKSVLRLFCPIRLRCQLKVPAEGQFLLLWPILGR